MSSHVRMMLTTLLTVVTSISFASAIIPNARLSRQPIIPRIHSVSGFPLAAGPDGTGLPSLNTTYYFDQLIDHNNTGLGTFKQRYWANWEFYQGGPIVLVTPGEGNAEDSIGYLSNETITGQIAQQQQGATVLLEHRFFGYSNPYDNLTVQSLELLTIEQAIEDFVYFAQNVDLPFPGGDNVKPDTTPWVLVGKSYSGALTSWTMVNKPGIFRAGYASSAVVEAISNFYDYFVPIQENMPQNCSADVQAVIGYLDQIYADNDVDAIQTLQQAFGLGNLSHVDDFASALQDNLFDWQSLQPDSGPGSMFYQFCDALEVKDSVSAPATGWGLQNAISAWGSFWNSTYYSYYCNTSDVEACLGTYDTSQPLWTNVTVNNANRSWYWMICNQMGWYQVGPPEGQPAIVSRIIQPVYYQRQCVNYFPEKFSTPPSPSVGKVNAMYKGWDVSVDRLFFATGRRDPWRGATVSADGLNKANTTMRPIYESDGFHGSDVVIANGIVDATVRAVQVAALECMTKWLS